MKTNILLVCISIFLLQSCGMSEQKRKENEEKTKRIHEEVVAIIRQDSINSIDQYKAIGEIMFGISESSFNKRKESFLSNFKTEYVLPKKRGRYGSSTEIIYNIGGYQFKYLSGSFRNDSLYNIYLLGKPIAYDDYDIRMQNQFNILFSILIEKYGEPIINSGFPKRTSIKKENGVNPCFWMIGKKQIEIDIYFDGVNYALWLVASLQDIQKKVDVENEIRRKRDEKERVKRAAESL